MTLLTISQAATELGVSPKTVRRLIDRKELRACRFAGRIVRVPADALGEFIQCNTGLTGNAFLTFSCDLPASTRETRMFDLEKFLQQQRRQKLAAAIKSAAKLIADCPDPERQWRAMRELRLLQERLGWPSI